MPFVSDRPFPCYPIGILARKVIASDRDYSPIIDVLILEIGDILT